MNIDEACCVLQVQLRDANPASVKRAYRRLALRHHPDKNLGREEEAKIDFQRVSEAYATLTAYFGGENRRSFFAESRNSEESRFSWNWARELFRKTFGVDFDDAANSASSTLMESKIGKRLSKGRAWNKAQIIICQNRAQLEQEKLNDARMKLRRASNERQAFENNPQIVIDDAAGVWVAFFTLICQVIGGRLFGDFVLDFLLVPLAALVHVNGFLYLCKYFRQITMLIKIEKEAKTRVHEQDIKLKMAQCAHRMAESYVTQGISLLAFLLDLD